MTIKMIISSDCCCCSCMFLLTVVVVNISVFKVYIMSRRMIVVVSVSSGSNLRTQAYTNNLIL